ncbi:MAG TPA: hypothetical protein VFW28_00510 [Micropepsaceae bacterium]|nr:hypothetical protein [Micropepsaceae bacterium]
MAKTDELRAEVHRIREILETIHDPYDRYQLTLLFETAARSFITPGPATPQKTAKGKKQCKALTHSLLN